MRKTAFLLTVAILMAGMALVLPVGACVSTQTPAITISPPSAFQSGTTDLMNTAIRGAPATSSLQGATTTLVQTFPMVPSIIRSTHYAIADAKLIFGLPPPALLPGTDMVTTTTRSDYSHTAKSAMITAKQEASTIGSALPEIVAGVSFTF